MANSDKQKGFALLLVIFIISLATIIVTAFSADTFSFVKRSRASTDITTADYAAHSALEVALSVLELPDEPGLSQQPWQILNAMPTLPIPGFSGEVKVQVVDSDSLINVNAILDINQSAGQGISGFQNQQNTGTTSALSNPSDFWKFALLNLFKDLGFSNYGNNGSSNSQMSPEQQIALMTDWIDPDQLPYSSSTFPGKGSEGSGNQQSINRPFRLLDELGRVPGMSKSFLQLAAPYMRVGSSGDYKININTAPPLVLKAMGFQDTELNGIIDKRQVQQLTTQELSILVPPSSNLASYVVTNSNNYKILVRSKTVSAVRWLEADCVVQSGFGKKIATIRSSRVL